MSISWSRIDQSGEERTLTNQQSSSLDVNDQASAAVPALQFIDVGKTFPDGTESLSELSLSVNHGEFVSVIGPSGCGKSTLLRLAAGLDQSSSGTCVVDRSNLGYVFQDPTLLPWRTVKQNIELANELGRSESRAEQPAAGLSVDEVVELVGLGGFENHFPEQLSGGMRMRVSIARALLPRPSVLLFDEPFAALDELTRERLNDETLRLFRNRQFAALFVTHSIAEAVFLSTEVHVISPRPGRIKRTIGIPFSYPRKPELRFDPKFTELCRQLSSSLREPTR